MRRRRIWSSTLVGSALVLSGGCGAPPPLRGLPPVAELVHDEFQAAGAMPEIRKEIDERAPWWRTIGGESLEDLLVEVQLGNRSLRASEFRALAARYGAQLAEARRSPRVDLDASSSGVGTRTRSSFLGSTTSESSSESYTLGARLRWEVDLWGRLARLSDAARAEAEALDADVRVLRLTLAEDAATQWVLHATALEQTALLEGQTDAVDRQIGVLVSRQQIGEPVLSQVQQLRSIRSGLAQDLALLRLEAERAAYRLHELRGKPMDDQLPAAPTLGAELDWRALLGEPRDLLEHRPDLQAAMDRLRAADAQTHAVFLERWPRLDLDAAAAFTSARIADLFLGELLRAAVSLSAPLIDGGRRQASENESVALRDAAVEDLASAVLAAMSEVEIGIAGVVHSADAEAAAVESAAFAREASEESRSRFLGAGGSALDALIAEERLLEAERRAVEIRRDRALAVIRLGIALGRIPDARTPSRNGDTP